MLVTSPMTFAKAQVVSPLLRVYELALHCEAGHHSSGVLKLQSIIHNSSYYERARKELAQP